MGKRKISASDSVGSQSKFAKLTSFGFKSKSSDQSDFVEPQLDSVVVGTQCTSSNVKTVATCKPRSFRKSWKYGRPWLRYDKSSNRMFCTICTDSQVRNSFTLGCSIMKKDQVIKHENAKDENSHKTALEAREHGNNLDTAMTNMLSKSKSAVMSALQNVHFAALNNLPNALIPKLYEHCITQGVTQLKDLVVDAHTTYSHNSSIQGFQQSLAWVIEDTLVGSVKESGIYSVMLDESTDVSVHQNMVVYIRFLETVSGRVEPCTQFLGIRQLSVADAQHITSELLDLLEAKGIAIEGLVGVSTDGASVMTGCRSGVVTQLREVTSGLLATHCIAHRLALASGSAADKVRYLVKFQDILNSMFKYFDKSPKNMSRLEAIQKVLENRRASRLKQVFHTRWLSFEGSVQSVVDNYSSVVSVFLEDNSARALSMHKPITSFKFLYVAHFLADILPHLAILCKSFQRSKINFTEVDSLLQSTVQVIEKLSVGRSGYNLNSFLSQVPSSPQVDRSGLVTFEFQGHTIRDGANQRSEAESACSQFVENLLANLRDRFSHSGDAAVLTGLTRIFDPSLVDSDEVLRESSDVVAEYIESCGSGTGQVARQEIQGFLAYAKFQIGSNRKVYSSVNDVIQLAVKSRSSFPLVARAAERLLVAPVSTVDCERGFSQQNLIKTDLRNSLCVKSLENLMRIRMGTTSSSDLYEKAYRHWSSIKPRRINQSKTFL